jgi:hypothetical protein
MTRQQNPIAAQIATEIDQAARQLAQTNAAIAATPALDTADLWRLFQSDSGQAWTALAGLSERQMVIQAQAMAAYLLDQEGKLISAERVLARWQEVLARRVVTQPPTTDLTIPSVAVILDAAQERGEQARIHGDFQGARQLDRVRANLLRGVGLIWQGGDLLVQSVNNPGAVYSVNRTGCTCPNGAAGRQTCYHITLYDLLIDLQEQAAIDADMRADRAAQQGEEPEPPRPSLGARIAQARAASAWWQQEAA